jgi:thymidylate synthase
MTESLHRNISFATIAGLSDVLKVGKPIEVRGSRVRELRNRVTILQRPRERCLFLPNRGNDVIASLAETIWVLAGRDDIEWLSTFLPRAHKFSDDGTTWRGAYGPRLRNWNGVDQIAECLRLLLEEVSSRRAVMSLFDPQRDFVTSMDIPCNNWLHWMVRDRQLHLAVAVRSNDIIWGFSGVNSFEWSVLQEMMAFWVGVEVGDATYLAGSFHLYDRHEERARRMIEGFHGVNCYDFGLTAPPFRTAVDQLEQVLKHWFALEAQARENPEREIEAQRHLGDPLLAVSAEIMRIHHGFGIGWSVGRLSEELARLPSCDLAAAAFEFYARRFPTLVESIPDLHIRQFIEAYTRGTTGNNLEVDLGRIADNIKHLHARKDAAYGIAWKKRGELTGILANIARKVDRLEQYMTTGVELADESKSDTAADLFVYLLKYQLFLLERAPAEFAATGFLETGEMALSENPAAFDFLVDQYKNAQNSSRQPQEVSAEIVADFEQLHRFAAEGSASVTERLSATARAAALAFELVCAFAFECEFQREAIATTCRDEGNRGI